MISEMNRRIASAETNSRNRNGVRGAASEFRMVESRKVIYLVMGLSGPHCVGRAQVVGSVAITAVENSRFPGVVVPVYCGRPRNVATGRRSLFHLEKELRFVPL